MESNASTNLSNLDRDRKYGRKLVDVQVKIEGGDPFPAHKSVLHSLSGYFREKLDNNRNLKKNETIIVKDAPVGPRITEDILILVLEFMYTEKLGGVTVENVKEMMSAAQLLKINKLRVKICEYLISILSPSTWSDVYNIAYLYDEGDLAEECLEMFRTSRKAINFTRLNNEQFQSVLEKEKQRMVPEKMFETILLWIKCKSVKEDRSILFKEYLKFIKFTDMQQSFIEKNVMEEDLVSNNPAAATAVSRALLSKLKNNSSTGTTQVTQPESSVHVSPDDYNGASSTPRSLTTRATNDDVPTTSKRGIITPLMPTAGLNIPLLIKLSVNIG